MGTVSVAPEVVDKALAVVVDEGRAMVAVWRGRSRIELHDLAGTRHDTAVASPLDDQGSWTRAEVLAFAHRALGAVVPISPGPPAAHPMLRVETADLQRAWLVRARPTGYALWNGADVVDVFDHEGAHRRAVPVPPADLSTLAQLMLDLVALAGRARDVPAATA